MARMVTVWFPSSMTYKMVTTSTQTVFFPSTEFLDTSGTGILFQRQDSLAQAGMDCGGQAVNFLLGRAEDTDFVAQISYLVFLSAR